MALSSVGSMRHRRARQSRTFACEGVRGTMLRIEDHTEPKSAERSEGPVGNEFICRSKKSIGWARGRRSRGARGLTSRCQASRAMRHSISPAGPTGKRVFPASISSATTAFRSAKASRRLTTTSNGHTLPSPPRMSRASPWDSDRFMPFSAAQEVSADHWRSTSAADWKTWP